MKNIKSPLLSSIIAGDDDNGIRPKKFDDFIGQRDVVEQLKVIIKASQIRCEPIDHILLAGPPGLGKTTLAMIIANESGGALISASGPTLDRIGLITTLVGLKRGDVFFIDEIHRMNKTLEETLYPAMEDFYIDLVLKEGDNSRPRKIKLDKFTLMGATTKAGLLSAPFRDRFGFVGRLDPYEIEDLVKVLYRSSMILGFAMTPEGAIEIAKRSRGTPRVTNRLLRRIIDYALVDNITDINKDVCEKTLRKLGIDPNGLDNIDRRILEVMIRDFNGGPVGLKNIAVSLGEEVRTIEDIYEPFLISKGLIKRSPRGREVTKKGREYEYLSNDVKEIKNLELTEIRISVRGTKAQGKKVEKKVLDGEIVGTITDGKYVDKKIVDVNNITDYVLEDIKKIAMSDVDVEDNNGSSALRLVDESDIIESDLRIHKDYSRTLSAIIPSLKKGINNSRTGRVKIFLADLRNEMGKSFLKVEDKKFFKGLRYVLGHNGVIIDEIKDNYMIVKLKKR